MTSIRPGLFRLATIFFICLIIGIRPIISRPPIGIDKDGEYYEALVNRQTKGVTNEGTLRNYVYIHTGSTVAVQHEDRGP